MEVQSSGESLSSVSGYFCKAVTDWTEDETFVRSANCRRAPVAMMAFAKEVVEQIVLPDKLELFDGLTLTVPAAKEMYASPQYHSIVGQKLLCVDWKKMHGIDNLKCPLCATGKLENARTNFSKNKILTPVFGLDGPSQWAIVMPAVQ